MPTCPFEYSMASRLRLTTTTEVNYLLQAIKCSTERSKGEPAQPSWENYRLLLELIQIQCAPITLVAA